MREAQGIILEVTLFSAEQLSSQTHTFKSDTTLAQPHTEMIQQPVWAVADPGRGQSGGIALGDLGPAGGQMCEIKQM